MILEGELHPGDRLPNEDELCRRFDVSRGSLREGVRALCAMGVLETRQGSGMYVGSLEAKRLLTAVRNFVELAGRHRTDEVEAVANLLESGAAAAAAARISDSEVARADWSVRESARARSAGDLVVARRYDDEFHTILVESAGNRVLAGLIELGRSPASSARLCALSEHEVVLRAVAERDPIRAQAAMVAHLMSRRAHLTSG